MLHSTVRSVLCWVNKLEHSLSWSSKTFKDGVKSCKLQHHVKTVWNVQFSFFHPDFRTFESLQPFLGSLPSKTADFFLYIFTACPKMPTSSSSVWPSQFSFPTDSDCTAVRITVLWHAIQLATSVYPEKNELRQHRHHIACLISKHIYSTAKPQLHFQLHC